MKNSGVLSKVRDTEEEEEKNISFVVLPVKKKKTRVGERKSLSLKLLSTVSPLISIQLLSMSKCFHGSL